MCQDDNGQEYVMRKRSKFLILSLIILWVLSFILQYSYLIKINAYDGEKIQSLIVSIVTLPLIAAVFLWIGCIIREMYILTIRR